MHIVLLKTPAIFPFLLLPPLAAFLRPDPTNGKRDSMDHSIEEIVRVGRMSSSAKGANALRGGLFGLMVLSRPE